MGYQATHFLYIFRRLVRSEEKPGSLKKLLAACSIALALVIIWNQLVMFGKRVKDDEELMLLNAIFSIRGEMSPPSEISLVKIDTSSYDKLNLSTVRTFPRGLFADAILEIQKDKPKLIIIDGKMTHDESLEEETKRLATALSLGPTTIVKVALDETDSSVGSDPLVAKAASMELVLDVDSFHGFASYLAVGRQSVLPLDRAFPLLAPLRAYVNPELETPKRNSLINFYGPADTIRGYPIWQLLEKDRLIPKGYFKDKVVFVGTSTEIAMRGMSNKEVLPVTAPGGEMFGVEIHATIGGNLLDGTWIRRTTPELETIFLFIALFVMIAGISTLHPLSSVLFVTLYLGTWFAATYILMTEFHFFLPGVLYAARVTSTIIAGVAVTMFTIVFKELESYKKMMGVK